MFGGSRRQLASCDRVLATGRIRKRAASDDHGSYRLESASFALENSDNAVAALYWNALPKPPRKLILFVILSVFSTCGACSEFWG
jgi:hypothetical protein